MVAHHSPKPSPRVAALLDVVSLLLPAAAEANVEGSVEGMVIQVVVEVC